VLAGVMVGQPMHLGFTGFEVVALGLASLIVTVIALDGESHWFEGVQLLAVYAILAIAAWFV
jgi:Ca2+:H+ antiporter